MLGPDSAFFTLFHEFLSSHNNQECLAGDCRPLWYSLFLIGGMTMYLLTTEQTFDAAHFLKGHDGACSNIHGHRWRVVARIASKELKSEGSSRAMVMDFSDFKQTLKELADYFDHTLIYEKGSLKPLTIEALSAEDLVLTEVPFRPTSECFSRHFYEEFRARQFPVYDVTVYETPTNCCTYRED